MDIHDRLVADMRRDQTPEGVSVAVANEATNRRAVEQALAEYPNRLFTGRVLHVSEPDEPGPGLTEYVFEVMP